MGILTHGVMMWLMRTKVQKVAKMFTVSKLYLLMLGHIYQIPLRKHVMPDQISNISSTTKIFLFTAHDAHPIVSAAFYEV